LTNTPLPCILYECETWYYAVKTDHKVYVMFKLQELLSQD